MKLKEIINEKIFTIIIKYNRVKKVIAKNDVTDLMINACWDKKEFLGELVLSLIKKLKELEEKSK